MCTRRTIVVAMQANGKRGCNNCVNDVFLGYDLQLRNYLYRLGIIFFIYGALKGVIRLMPTTSVHLMNLESNKQVE